MCNRTIAPLKMMHRIKHMRENFDEPSRIQLYEYLDLILWYVWNTGLSVEVISETPTEL
jgi:hypothetical protein